MEEFETAVKNRFRIKDQGPINGREFLGIEVDYNQTRGIVNLHCDKYIRSSLSRLGISHLTPAPTPIRSLRDFSQSAAPIDGTTVEKLDFSSTTLRQIASIMNYAVAICRPDLAAIASTLSSTKWDEITSYDKYIGLTFPSLPLRATQEPFQARNTVQPLTLRLRREGPCLTLLRRQ